MTRHCHLLAWMFIAALLATVPGIAPRHAAAQEKAREKFGDWELNCGKPPGAQEEKCAIEQNVIDEDRANIGLKAVFLFASQGERVLRVAVPLGVLLPFGLGLKIDEETIGDKPLPFIRCRPVIGCFSEIIVKDALLDKLKSGKTAYFIIVETVEQGRAIPVSLEGFTKALERLTAVSKTE